MLIEILNPAIEALIQQRLDTGAFRSAEEVVMQALEAAPLPESYSQQTPTRTGAELIAAMQAMPYPDIELEYPRPYLPVRDIVL